MTTIYYHEENGIRKLLNEMRAFNKALKDTMGEKA